MSLVTAALMFAPSRGHAQGVSSHYLRTPAPQLHLAQQYDPPSLPPEIMVPERRPVGRQRAAPPIAAVPLDPLPPEPTPTAPEAAPRVPVENEPNPLIGWCKEEANAKAPLCRNVGSPRVQGASTSHLDAIGAALREFRWALPELRHRHWRSTADRRAIAAALAIAAGRPWAANRACHRCTLEPALRHRGAFAFASCWHHSRSGFGSGAGGVTVTVGSGGGSGAVGVGSGGSGSSGTAAIGGAAR